jgi:hypothetical protein
MPILGDSASISWLELSGHPLPFRTTCQPKAACKKGVPAIPVPNLFPLPGTTWLPMPAVLRKIYPIHPGTAACRNSSGVPEFVFQKEIGQA